jgi:hypothetical protein
VLKLYDAHADQELPEEVKTAKPRWKQLEEAGLEIPKYVKARFQLSRTAELEWLLESGEKVAAKTLYHGTHRQLEELTPRDEHGDPRVKPAIFASPSRTFALAYTGKKWGDRDIEQSTGKGMTLREMRPGALQDIFGGQKGYLHHLSPDSFTALKGRRTAKEVVSYEAVAPKKIEVIPDALKALKRLPDVKLVAYDPTTPETHAAIKRQIRRMGEMTTQDARGYKRWWFEVAPPEMKSVLPVRSGSRRRQRKSTSSRGTPRFRGSLSRSRTARGRSGRASTRTATSGGPR